MGIDRKWCIVVMAAAGVTAAAGVFAAEEGAEPGSGPSPVKPAAIEVMCSPVNISWPSSVPPSAREPGPTLSVVSADFRPKDVPLFLDGQFVGRARYFNGKKGFLYLKPGRYQLAAASDGLKTEVFSIDARPGCRFDIKHRMVKGQQGREEGLRGAARKGQATAVDLPHDRGIDRGRSGWSPQPGPGPEPAAGPRRDEIRRGPIPASHGLVENPSASRHRRRFSSMGDCSRPARRSPGWSNRSRFPRGPHTILVRAAGFTDRTVTIEFGTGRN